MTRKNPTVYLLASKPRGTLYIGVTSDIVQRIWQHREGLVEGFSKRYGVKTLVWYEQHPTMMSAIAKEKSMKQWRRLWKIELIERSNAQWRDLWFDLVGIVPEVVIPAQTGIHTISVIPAPAGSQTTPVIPAQAGSQTTPVIPAPAGIQGQSTSVIPAKAGIQGQARHMDSRLRGNDDGLEDAP